MYLYNKVKVLKYLHISYFELKKTFYIKLKKKIYIKYKDKITRPPAMERI